MLFTPAYTAPALAVALLLPAAASAATFTVNDTGDAPLSVSVPCNGGITPCTLRAAIEAANNNPASADTINFNFSSGSVTIEPQSPLPAIAGVTTIDGYALGAGIPNTLPVGNDAYISTRIDGANAGAGTHGLRFVPGASGSVLRGLAITGFGGHGVVLDGQGSANGLVGVAIAGNFIGTNGSGTGGDQTGALVNLFSGIYIDNSASNTTVGGANPADRNLIVASSSGRAVSLGASPGTLVQGNYIGTNRAGTARVSTHTGIAVASPQGAGSMVRGNVIGAADTGVILHGGARNATLQGNAIGVGADGTASVAGSGNGVYITDGGLPLSPWFIHIGGTDPGEGNTVGHWGGNGIRVEHSSAPAPALRYHSFTNNSIHGNAGRGIALVDTAGSDPATVNSGQPAPAITGATSTVVNFSFSSVANTTQRFEVFGNTSCGTPQGRVFLGSLQTGTDGSGQVNGSINLPPQPAGTYLSMTATRYFSGGGGNNQETSEFSACAQVPGGPAGNPSAIPTLGHAALALLAALLASLVALKKRAARA